MLTVRCQNPFGTRRNAPRQSQSRTTNVTYRAQNLHIVRADASGDAAVSDAEYAKVVEGTGPEVAKLFNNPEFKKLVMKPKVQKAISGLRITEDFDPRKLSGDEEIIRALELVAAGAKAATALA